jgi:hypothetical protein
MTFKFFAFCFLVIHTLSNSTYANTKKPLEWKIVNTTWTKSFEKSYEEFVATIGMASKEGFCHTTNDCLRSPKANPRFYHLNPDRLKNVFSDCADLPYILRAYFSWMNDLPFTFPTLLTPSPDQSPGSQWIVAEITKLELELATAGIFKKLTIKGKIKDLKKKLYGGKPSADIRYNLFGNQIVDKRYVKNGESINNILSELEVSISTATFRTNGANNTTTELFRDTYPINISKASIKAGTVLYDQNGHIAVVYEVLKNGKIHLIDAHPDNSLTNITYGEKFTRTPVEIGGGFSNWRPFSYDGIEVHATSNAELADYSLEQFQKSDNYIFEGRTMSFYEYVRNKLSLGALVYKPIQETLEILEEICNDMKERNLSVIAATSKGIHNNSHPDKLPENIYGTDGDWETYSSPSRDARLKASIREGRNVVAKMIAGYKDSDPSIQYDGVDLMTDLVSAYKTSTRKCTLDIKKTNGSTVTLNLKDILANIYKLSFDPYHCSELRWGLTDPESLKSCSQSKEKLEWYSAEQGLRNRIDRDYSMKMDFDLKTLPFEPISKVIQENISFESVLQ